MTIIAPSVLAADFGNLANEIKSIESAKADWVHIDVMDGRFVPPITFGDNMVKTAKGCSNLYRDVHLMVNKPEDKFQDFVNSGAQSITFHIEACQDAKTAIKKLRDLGVNVGITLNPATAIETILPYISLVDLVLIMSVQPGWGGQKFMPESLEKVKIVKGIIQKENLNTLIQIDGGINFETAKLACEAGVNVLVAGTYIFSAINRADQIKSIRL